MDKLGQLWIRACKAQDSIKRLQSIYRRFYGDYGTVENSKAIANILTGMVDTYHPMPIGKYLANRDQYQSYDSVAIMMGSQVLETTEHMLNIYIMRDRLRYIDRKQMNILGINEPAKWRNK